ncbi:hypothetical protein ACFQ38_00200 [Sporosarcina contaminans]|uniref:Uncharacterized protein n=1 Tax=Sporosarcina contaminans TaxID=633403 RepID=A0ABW3TSU4_9BACL
MLKFDIPSAASMADLAKQKEQEFETAVMEGPVFRDIMQRIENAALEGKTAISVTVQDFEHRQALNVISKYLTAAGYVHKHEDKSSPFNLIPEVSISWGPGATPERR